MLSAGQKVSAKQEDQEIEGMAQEIREANRKKMALAASIPTFSIHSFGIQTSQSVTATTATPSNEASSADLASQQGQFGWADCEGKFIPYLTRLTDKYVAQRMIDDRIMGKFNQVFNNEVYSCCKLQGAKMTQAEAELLNEINIRHCDRSFGEALFAENDNMISLHDVLEMAEFLKFVHAVVLENNTNARKRCGFFSISSTSFAPYVWLDGKQYVPMFFFDGQCEYLEEKAVNLSGWELAYLKLLCKLQGIRKEFFDKDTIRMAELEHAKGLLAPGTLLEDVWPSKHMCYSSLLKRPKRSRPKASNTVANTQRAIQQN